MYGYTHTNLSLFLYFRYDNFKFMFYYQSTHCDVCAIINIFEARSSTIHKLFSFSLPNVFSTFLEIVLKLSKRVLTVCV